METYLNLEFKKKLIFFLVYCTLDTEIQCTYQYSDMYRFNF